MKALVMTVLAFLCIIVIHSVHVSSGISEDALAIIIVGILIWGKL